ncbi:hypothetical protein Patl1_07845 [Pistacia atlantica]|uniref:Uncharacterized protein n=1 Tax=Pistacia atlantica TaxID=434234 RepID=A0ACC1ACR3_9ROSI|nr:hypothetical protein Patl1_07845 [Pistacia atlantica]
MRTEDLLSNKVKLLLVYRNFPFMKFIIYNLLKFSLMSYFSRERDLLLVQCFAVKESVIECPAFLLASKTWQKGFKGNKDAELFKKIKIDAYMHSAIIECYEILQEILCGLLEDEADKKVVTQICDEVDASIQRQRFLSEFRMSGLLSLNYKLKEFLKFLLYTNLSDKLCKSRLINLLQDIMEIITQDIMVNGNVILESAQLNSQHTEFDKKSQTFEKINIHVGRLFFLLTVESPINMPRNLDAHRRITFFVNSLFMDMPSAPKVRDMLSFSVLTPYYKEDVLYSVEELRKENVDGISILFYLKTIYPVNIFQRVLLDEWANFQHRINDPKLNYSEETKMEFTRQWGSYRGQTLSRTVRGMMYYKQALELQCFLEIAGDREISGGCKTLESSGDDEKAFAQALADMKFTYVVSCQIYGAMKTSDDARDQSCYNNILNLMVTYPSLRVAYIDEREEIVNGKFQKLYYSVLLKGSSKLDQEIYRIKLPGPPTVIGEGKAENQNHAIIFTRGEALQTIDMNQDNYFEEAFKMRNVLEEFLDSSGQQKPAILGLREHIFTGSVSSLASFTSNQETSFVTIGQRTLANLLRVRFHYGHPDIFDRIFHITRGGISKASKIINLSQDIFAGFNSTLRGGNIVHREYIQVGKGRGVGMNQISLFEAKVANGNGEQTLSRDVYRLGHSFDFYRMLSFYFSTVGFYFSSMVTVLTIYVFLYGHIYLVMSGAERYILGITTIHQSKALEEALAVQSVIQLGLFSMLPMVLEIGLEKGFRAAFCDFIFMQLQLASVFFTFQLGTKAHHYGRTILHGGSNYQATGLGFVSVHAKFSENYRLYSRSHFVKALELVILLVLTRTPQRHNYTGRILEIILIFRNFIYQYGIVYHLDIAKHSKTLLVYGISWIVPVTVLLVLKMMSICRRILINFPLIVVSLKAFITLYLAIAQVCRPLFKALGLWESIKELAQAYDYAMGLVIFAPIALLSWFPIVSKLQTRLLFK